MYFLLGISLMFALLLLLNLLISTAATVLWRTISPAAESWTAQRRAQTIFALRIFPFVSALVFVIAILVPAYLLFEPKASGEVVGLKLGLLAIASTGGIIIAFYRIFGTWWKTRRLISNWLKHAEPIEIANVSVPIYRMQHPFPVIAIVGMFRPRIFIARQIFDALNEEELQAAIAHEYGHLAARDNFKRTLLRVSRDLLVFPFGRSLDRAWSENAESAADEYAAQKGHLTAVSLAAALVKIARIVPHGTKPAMPSGAFLITEQTDFVTYRIRRLLQLSEIKLNPADYEFFGFGFMLWILPAAASIIIVFLATNQNFLEQIHSVLESIVALLD